MENNNIKKIDEEILGNVSGGDMDPGKVIRILDYQNGYPVKWQDANGNVWHYACPKCNGIMHWGKNSCLYCDPCSKWFWLDLDKYKVYDVFLDPGTSITG
ncbi:MAG: hypothetical protein Q4C42_11105 [Clostridia bacterium]|nr:hypothetical protein [Clostridia bacterium]